MAGNSGLLTSFGLFAVHLLGPQVLLQVLVWILSTVGLPLGHVWAAATRLAAVLIPVLALRVFLKGPTSENSEQDQSWPMLLYPRQRSRPPAAPQRLVPAAVQAILDLCPASGDDRPSHRSPLFEVPAEPQPALSTASPPHPTATAVIITATSSSSCWTKTRSRLTDGGPQIISSRMDTGQHHSKVHTRYKAGTGMAVEPHPSLDPPRPDVTSPQPKTSSHIVSGPHVTKSHGTAFPAGPLRGGPKCLVSKPEFTTLMAAADAAVAAAKVRRAPQPISWPLTGAGVSLKAPVGLSRCTIAEDAPFPPPNTQVVMELQEKTVRIGKRRLRYRGYRPTDRIVPTHVQPPAPMEVVALPIHTRQSQGAGTTSSFHGANSSSVGGGVRYDGPLLHLTELLQTDRQSVPSPDSAIHVTSRGAPHGCQLPLPHRPPQQDHWQPAHLHPHQHQGYSRQAAHAQVQPGSYRGHQLRQPGPGPQHVRMSIKVPWAQPSQLAAGGTGGGLLDALHSSLSAGAEGVMVGTVLRPGCALLQLSMLLTSTGGGQGLSSAAGDSSAALVARLARGVGALVPQPPQQQRRTRATPDGGADGVQMLISVEGSLAYAVSYNAELAEWSTVQALPPPQQSLLEAATSPEHGGRWGAGADGGDDGDGSNGGGSNPNESWDVAIVPPALLGRLGVFSGRLKVRFGTSVAVLLRSMPTASGSNDAATGSECSHSDWGVRREPRPVVLQLHVDVEDAAAAAELVSQLLALKATPPVEADAAAEAPAAVGLQQPQDEEQDGDQGPGQSWERGQEKQPGHAEGWQVVANCLGRSLPVTILKVACTAVRSGGSPLPECETNGLGFGDGAHDCGGGGCSSVDGAEGTDDIAAAHEGNTGGGGGGPAAAGASIRIDVAVDGCHQALEALSCRLAVLSLELWCGIWHVGEVPYMLVYEAAPSSAPSPSSALRGWSLGLPHDHAAMAGGVTEGAIAVTATAETAAPAAAAGAAAEAVTVRDDPPMRGLRPAIRASHSGADESICERNGSSGGGAGIATNTGDGAPAATATIPRAGDAVCAELHALAAADEDDGCVRQIFADLAALELVATVRSTGAASITEASAPAPPAPQPTLEAAGVASPRPPPPPLLPGSLDLSVELQRHLATVGDGEAAALVGIGANLLSYTVLHGLPYIASAVRENLAVLGCGLAEADELSAKEAAAGGGRDGCDAGDGLDADEAVQEGACWGGHGGDAVVPGSTTTAATERDEDMLVDDGLPLVHMAALSGNLGMVHLLLCWAAKEGLGPDWAQRRHQGCTALELAAAAHRYPPSSRAGSNTTPNDGVTSDGGVVTSTPGPQHGVYLAQLEALLAAWVQARARDSAPAPVAPELRQLPPRAQDHADDAEGRDQRPARPPRVPGSSSSLLAARGPAAVPAADGQAQGIDGGALPICKHQGGTGPAGGDLPAAARLASPDAASAAAAAVATPMRACAAASRGCRSWRSQPLLVCVLGYPDPRMEAQFRSFNMPYEVQMASYWVPLMCMLLMTALLRRYRGALGGPASAVGGGSGEAATSETPMSLLFAGPYVPLAALLWLRSSWAHHHLPAWWLVCSAARSSIKPLCAVGLLAMPPSLVYYTRSGVTLVTDTLLPGLCERLNGLPGLLLRVIDALVHLHFLLSNHVMDSPAGAVMHTVLRFALYVTCATAVERLRRSRFEAQLDRATRAAAAAAASGGVHGLEGLAAAAGAVVVGGVKGLDSGLTGVKG